MNYVMSGGGGGGGRAKDGTTTDSGRSNQFGWCIVGRYVCVVVEDLHVAGKEYMGKGYISVKWLDLVLTLLWHKERIEGRRRVCAGEKLPNSERERERKG